MSVGELATFLYPRMFALHRLPERSGTKLDDGTVSMPPWERLNNTTLTPEGCFLLDNGQKMFMWIGQQVDPMFLRQVFGVDNLRAPEAENLQMVRENNPLVSRIKAIVSTLHDPYSLQRWSNTQVHPTSHVYRHVISSSSVHATVHKGRVHYDG